ncbi:hypothetical protein HOH87_01340 [bacterium]|nr:hypothetical protein [bacterium]
MIDSTPSFNIQNNLILIVGSSLSITAVASVIGLITYQHYALQTVMGLVLPS